MLCIISLCIVPLCMCISFLSDDERVGCVLDVLHLHVEDGGQRFASRNRREYITTHAGMEKKGEEGRREEERRREKKGRREKRTARAVWKLWAL